MDNNLNESYIFTKDDIKINLEQWGSPSNKVLFITGLSGSGKSTMSEEYEREYNVEMFEMDGIYHGYDSSNSGIINYLKKKYTWYEHDLQTRWKDSYNSVFDRKMNDLTNSAIEYIYSTKKKFVVEGIQIFYMHKYMNYDFSNKPLIIKGTSVIKSCYRMLNREKDNLNIKGILGMLAQYVNDEKLLNHFKKSYVKRKSIKEGVNEMSIRNILNKECNFDYMIETMTNLAMSLNNDSSIKALKEDVAFECENFLYSKNAKPQISLDKRILTNKYLSENFNKEELKLDGEIVTSYRCKDNINIIIKENHRTGDLVLQYNESFESLKENKLKDKVIDDMNNELEEVLKESNNFSMIEASTANNTNLRVLTESTVSLFEDISNIDDVLTESTSNKILNMYDEIKKLTPDHTIAYNESVINGNVTPMLTFIDEYEDVDAIYHVMYKENYKNNYETVLVKTYGDEFVDELLSEKFTIVSK